MSIPDIVRKLRFLWAAKTGNVQDIQELLSYGMDANVTLYGGGTALLAVVACCQDDVSARAAHLLLKAGAFVDSRLRSGWTPLILAASRGHSATTAVLLEFGANPNYISLPDDSCAVVEAVLARSSRVLQQLINAGATPDINTSSVGTTPLMIATVHQDIDSVRILLEANANVGAVDETGCTALHAAVEVGWYEGIRLLIEYSSDPDKCNREGVSANDMARRMLGIRDLRLL